MYVLQVKYKFWLHFLHQLIFVPIVTFYHNLNYMYTVKGNKNQAQTTT